MANRVGWPTDGLDARKRGLVAGERERLAPRVEPLAALLTDVMDEYAAGRRVPRVVYGRLDVELTAALREGLEWRLGLYLYDAECELLTQLREVADMPTGLSVCESCLLVFVPRRQFSATKCAHCHHRPNARPVGFHHDGEGSLVFNVPGERRCIRKLGTCAACGGAVFAKQTNALYCSDDCRKGRPQRERALSDDADAAHVRDFTVPLSLTFRQLIEDRRHELGHGLRNAACDRCHRYYKTSEPARGRCPSCDSSNRRGPGGSLTAEAIRMLNG